MAEEMQKATDPCFYRILWRPLIAPILLEKGIHLTTLNYEGFKMRDSRKVYEALASHKFAKSLVEMGRGRGWAGQ